MPGGKRTISAALLWGGVATAAFAQAAPANVVVYDADYFLSFSPRTALDMVERVPGFTLQEGEERRGFAAAVSNVLIDGAPPTVKSDDVDDILERIPAADVVRIELIRGDAESASSAQAVRVNVVRRPSAGAGVWEASLAHAEDGRISPAAMASWSGRRGALEYALSATLEDAHTPLIGEDLAFDASGDLEGREQEQITEDESERRLTGELKSPLAGGQLDLNLTLSSEEGHERHDVQDFEPSGAVDGRELVDALEREEIGELGLTYDRVWGLWETEWAALISRRHLTEDEASEEFDATGAFDEGEREERDIEIGETILRGGAERAFSNEISFAFGAEAALNTLEQRLALTLDDGSGPAAVIVPGANVRIEEERAEAYATLAWRMASWRLEGHIAAEASRLTQTGDSQVETELTYWKPSLQVVRSLGDDDQLRFRIYRDIGQLDFEDFTASAELSGGEVSAGNADLRPETSWRFEASGDWRFDQGAVELTLFYWRIEDALDYVPVGAPPDLFDARGNIGDGRLWGLRTAFELPMPLIDNARLRIEAAWQDSEVTDPLTGASRPQSEIQENLIAVEFRQDWRALRFAWGVEYEREQLAPQFRLDRVADEQDGHEAELWIETTRFEGVTLRVFAVNLSQPRETRERALFEPDRAGAFEGRDVRDRELGQLFGVEVRGVF